MITQPRAKITCGEIRQPQHLRRRGLAEVSHPTVRRVVIRIEL
jgi:hypothetical protein